MSQLEHDIMAIDQHVKDLEPSSRLLLQLIGERKQVLHPAAIGGTCQELLCVLRDCQVSLGLFCLKNPTLFKGP